MHGRHLDFLRPPRLKRDLRDIHVVFLDSRDLIGCLEKGTPVSSTELGSILRARRARLALTSITIGELFPGGDVPTPADVERGVELTRKLDHVPHEFIRISTITTRELRAAHGSWESGDLSPRRVNPFVDRFYKTLWKPMRGSTDEWLEDDETQALDRMPVWDQVRLLAMHPKSLRWDEKYGLRLSAAVDADRATYGSKRGTRQAREAALQRQLNAIGLSTPTGGLSGFAKWIYENPTICPGWRIGWDAWEDYRANVGAAVDPNDLRDFALLAAIPYVTHLTLDAKWYDLVVARAYRRRLKEKLPAPYFERVFRNLADVLRAIDA
jgi:hypothetical protein